jgi:hypothetical protein
MQRNFSLLARAAGSRSGRQSDGCMCQKPTLQIRPCLCSSALFPGTTGRVAAQTLGLVLNRQQVDRSDIEILSSMSDPPSPIDAFDDYSRRHGAYAQFETNRGPTRQEICVCSKELAEYGWPVKGNPSNQVEGGASIALVTLGPRLTRPTHCTSWLTNPILPSSLRSCREAA